MEPSLDTDINEVAIKFGFGAAWLISAKRVRASMTAWYTLRLWPSDATKQALGLFVTVPRVELGRSVGSQATSVKADISLELIRASSVMPPDFERGPTGSTLHKISSLQKA